MPRNSTGNYTLPLPPVVSGELIEATWANTTLDDIGQALTDSLDRYGRGGMLAPFLFADGTVSNPGAAWANAPGTGIFRDSTHLGFTWNGAEVWSYNANGIQGKVNTLTMTGTLHLGPDANILFNYGNTETQSSLIGITTPDDLGRAVIQFSTTANGAGSDSSIEFWTNAFGISRAARLIIQPNGVLDVYKDIDFKDSAGGFSLLNAAGTDRQWKIAAGTFTGDGDFGIYNVGAANWGLTINSTDNQLTFGGTTKYPNDTAMRFVDSGGTDRWLLGKGGNTDDRFVLYNFVTGTDAFSVSPTLNTVLFPSDVTSSARFTVTRANDNAPAFLWNFGGEDRFYITSIGGWPGIEWHMPAVAFIGMYQVSDGSIRVSPGRDITTVNASFYPNGDFAAKRIIAGA